MPRIRFAGGETAMKTSVIIALLLSSTLAHAEKTHPCAANAIKQAKALLIFHTGADANVGVDDTYKLLAPLRNPVNPRQSFDVLEVHGYVYRANYQMRLIYAQLPGSCVLMGQEILERSSL
jgi:hypothetical protein